MNDDVREMLRRDMQSAESKRDQVRREFPWCTQFADQFRNVFGDVKARYFCENGRKIGRPADEGNVDAFRMLDMIDAAQRMKSGKRK